METALNSKEERFSREIQMHSLSHEARGKTKVPSTICERFHFATVNTFLTLSTTSTYPDHPPGSITVSPATHLLDVPSEPSVTNIVPSTT
mmetsp:Transcript_38987/g.93838  ORF Transcript_38987/g.93838 Transcript_38987/m.93838 type:complete len:90 (+) Transcript_38987:286-555(+)